MIDVRHKMIQLLYALMAKKIEFEIENDSYGTRSQVEIGLNGQMKNEQVVVKSHSKELMRRLGKMGLP
jgi:hypothetical protein